MRSRDLAFANVRNRYCASVCRSSRLYLERLYAGEMQDATIGNLGAPLLRGRSHAGRDVRYILYHHGLASRIVSIDSRPTFDLCG